MEYDKTIAIIGNGFDLAHGCNTRYQDFIQKVESKALDTFRSFCDEKSIDEWYDFEKNIEALTIKYFISSMDDSEDYKLNRKKVSTLTSVINQIRDLLVEFLRNETYGKTIQKQANIEKYLSPHTFAINFNYTPTAESYTDNVYYVHGSIKEHDIVLGYDYRDEPCFIGYEEMQWKKQLCRERLEFRRIIKSECHLNPEDEQFCRLNNAFIAYQAASNSNRGLDPDEWPKQYLPEYAFINKWSKRVEGDIIDKIKEKPIETAVIIGHGIKADKVLLKTIFANLTSLKEIVIFCRNEDSHYNLEYKTAFLKPFCDHISFEYYQPIA